MHPFPIIHKTHCLVSHRLPTSRSTLTLQTHIRAGHPEKKTKGDISLIWTPSAGEDLRMSEFVGLHECRYMHMCSILLL